MGLGGRAHHDALPPAKAVRLQLLGSYQRPECWAHRGRVRPEATTGLRRLGAASNLSWGARRRLGCTSEEASICLLSETSKSTDAPWCGKALIKKGHVVGLGCFFVLIPSKESGATGYANALDRTRT